MADRCKSCFNSRIIMSENGYHSICCLSQKKALNCLLGKKDHYIDKDKVANNIYRPN